MLLAVILFCRYDIYIQYKADYGFKIIANDDVTAVWDYPNTEIALKGLLSAGPVAKAIDNSSLGKAYDAVASDIQLYIQQNGSVIYKNKYRVVISEK